ncbi:hypothetical protein BDD14_6521 [Edaphobacter modestus]|uniref:Uncharacterized protein n=1 Tax=Edaphobacter modestus TaxID=388466 RepID=A0A4V2G1E9_9BACT|nr:hypothetical protein BDD14_6521 [Edaphobacter modestus]
MICRRFLVSCFLGRGNTKTVQSTVIAWTAADSAIEFCRTQQLGEPQLPLREECSESDSGVSVAVWSVEAPSEGLRIWIREPLT